MGGTLGVEEGDNNDSRENERELGYRCAGRGMVWTRNKEGYGTTISPLGRSTPEEEYARARGDNRTNGKE